MFTIPLRYLALLLLALLVLIIVILGPALFELYQNFKDSPGILDGAIGSADRIIQFASILENAPRSNLLL